jgi:PAS domain S-box-containing protein
MDQNLQSVHSVDPAPHPLSYDSIADILNSSEAILTDLAKVFFEPSDPETFVEQGSDSVPLPNVADKYKALIEQIPAVVFMANLEGGLGEAYVSPQIETLLGFTQEEWLEDPVRWYRQIHPDDKLRWSVEAAEMFLSGKPLRSAYRVLSRDGRIIWFQCEARMVRWKDGRPWFIHGVGFDITNLKQTEIALQREQNLISTLLDTVGSLVIVLDGEGRIIRFNRAAQEITGYSFDEMNGEFLWTRLMDSGDAVLFRQHLAEHRVKGDQIENESTWRTKYGGTCVIAWSLTRLCGVGNMSELIVLGGIDITERKRLERLALAREAAKTEEALELLQRSIDSMSESFLFIDLEGRIRRSNEAAMHLFGIRNEHLVGRSLEAVVSNDQIPWTPAMLLVRSPEGRCYLETTLQLESGAVIVSLSCAVVRDSTGAITGAVFVFQDISARKEAEQALRRTEKLAATGRLAATIAHEINNPLEGVTNLLYMARRDLKPGNKIRRYLEMADQELERVAHLAKQTLGFYRDSTLPHTFNIGEAIQDVLAIYSKRGLSRNITFEKQIDPNIQAFGFPGEFRQVISNLVVNAVDAMADTGGYMYIRCRKVIHRNRPDRARIIVADTGPGIPIDGRSRIFEAFYTTKKHTGTGLGLWLSRSIIEKYGGTIRLWSRTGSPPTGTAFVVDFPLNSRLHENAEQLN